MFGKGEHQPFRKMQLSQTENAFPSSKMTNLLEAGSKEDIQLEAGLWVAISINRFGCIPSAVMMTLDFKSPDGRSKIHGMKIKFTQSKLPSALITSIALKIKFKTRVEWIHNVAVRNQGWN